MTNRKIVNKRGSVKTVRMTITDADGLPVDLTGFAITAYVTRRNSTAHVRNATITLLNQLTFKGKFDATFDETDLAVPAGSYDLEVKTINGNGVPEYFPCVEGVPFGKYVLEESKAV
jgi:hypothetical protein